MPRKFRHEAVRAQRTGCSFQHQLVGSKPKVSFLRVCRCSALHMVQLKDESSALQHGGGGDSSGRGGEGRGHLLVAAIRAAAPLLLRPLLVVAFLLVTTATAVLAATVPLQMDERGGRGAQGCAGVRRFHVSSSAAFMGNVQCQQHAHLLAAARRLHCLSQATLSSSLKYRTLQGLLRSYFPQLSVYCTAYPGRPSLPT